MQFILISGQVGLARLQFPDRTISAEPQFVKDLIIAIMQPIHETLQGNAGLVASLHALNALAISAVAVMTAIYARKLP